MPVETEAGLEPEQIARAKPDRRDAGLAQEKPGEAFRLARGKRDLIAVLACITRARDEGLESREPRRPRAHEGHALEALSGRKARQCRGGKRALKRDQRGFGQFRQPDASGQMLAQDCEVDRLSRRVDNELELPVRGGGARSHEVVEDPAFFVEQLGIALAPGGEAPKVGGAELLEKGRDGAMIGALEQRLAHMGNVEQPRRFAGVEMLGEDSRGILDRHVVAGERPHARAKLDMQGVERGLLGRGFGHRSASREKAPALRVKPRMAA